MRERDIFIEAIEQPDPEERNALLNAACRDDAALRNRVEQLLAAHERQESFILDSPPGGIDAAMDHPRLSEHPGTVIGVYKLLQQIGEGGMGVVFMAQQTAPIQRTVALKVIKPGMDTRQVITRFEAERQALALMDHPNIATVLDAGTTESGRPYFVMELVKGVPITKYCDSKCLSLRARLKLMLPVCQAVQHAHQKGLIHRDIKPSNVLVAAYDEQAVPKIIDFGVAKATAQKLTDRTMFTEFGQILGTVEYMSPEQAKLNQLDIDTRSDIYSLGVLLYELLTGSTPFGGKRLQEAPFDEMLRIIREEDPPKPSTRLSTAEGLPSIAANRSSEPLKLNRLVRGELDWVVMKALEKDRSRRYQTANGFAADIQRYLDDEAVEACPPSASYRLKKVLRRNKGRVAAAALMLLALVLGIIGTTWQAVRAITAEKQARQEQERTLAEKQRADDEAAIAKAVNDFLLKDLLQPATRGAFALGPQTPPDPNIRIADLLNRAADQVGARFKDQPKVEAAIREVIASSYSALTQVDKALPNWARIAELKALYLGPNHPETIMCRMVLAEQYYAAGRTQDAIKILNAIRDAYPPNPTPNGPDELANLRRLAANYRQVGQPAGALPIYERLRAIYAATDGADAPPTLQVLLDMSRTHRVAGRSADADRLLGQVAAAVARLDQQDQQDHQDVDQALDALAEAYRDVDRPSDAIPLFQRQLERLAAKYGQDSAKVLFASINLAYAYFEADRPADAIPILERIRDHQIKFGGGLNDTNAISNSFMLSLAYRRAGRPADAIPVLEQIREIQAAADPISADAIAYAHNLAQAYSEAGRFPEARKILEETLATLKVKLGTDNPEQLATQYASAIPLLISANGQEPAKDLCRELLGLMLKDGAAVNSLAWFLATAENPANRDPPMAVELATKAVELGPQSAGNWNTLGVARYRAGEFKQAVADLERAASLDNGGCSEDFFFLAMAHWQQGQKDDARKCYDKAVGLMDKHHPQNKVQSRFHAEAEELMKNKSTAPE